MYPVLISFSLHRRISLQLKFQTQNRRMSTACTYIFEQKNSWSINLLKNESIAMCPRTWRAFLISLCKNPFFDSTKFASTLEHQNNWSEIIHPRSDLDVNSCIGQLSSLLLRRKGLFVYSILRGTPGTPHQNYTATYWKEIHLYTFYSIHNTRVERKSRSNKLRLDDRGSSSMQDSCDTSSLQFKWLTSGLYALAYV